MSLWTSLNVEHFLGTSNHLHFLIECQPIDYSPRDSTDCLSIIQAIGFRMSILRKCTNVVLRRQQFRNSSRWLELTNPISNEVRLPSGLSIKFPPIHWAKTNLQHTLGIRVRPETDKPFGGMVVKINPIRLTGAANGPVTMDGLRRRRRRQLRRWWWRLRFPPIPKSAHNKNNNQGKETINFAMQNTHTHVVEDIQLNLSTFNAL